MSKGKKRDLPFRLPFIKINALSFNIASLIKDFD